MGNPLCEPIARGGEPIYASIIRNRSGIDSGCIDYGCRVTAIEELSDGDRQDIADTAYALYESVCRASGKKALRDLSPNAGAVPRRSSDVGTDPLLDALDDFGKRGGRMVFWTCPKGCRDIVDWNHDGGKSIATCRKCGTSNSALDGNDPSNTTTEAPNAL